MDFGGDLWGEDQITAPSLTAEFARPFGIDWYDNALSPEKTEYWNAYLQAKYRLTDQWAVLAGGRVDFQKDAKPDEREISGPRLGPFYSPWENLTLKYLFNSTKRRPQANEAGQAVGGVFLLLFLFLQKHGEFAEEEED